MLPTAATKLTGSEKTQYEAQQTASTRGGAVAAKGKATPTPPPRVERTPNLSRVQMALHSVMQSDKSASKDYVMEANAAELVSDYSTELAVSIVEDAALVAKHRGAPEIEAADINVVLVKKYHIHLPPAVADLPRLVLHKEQLGTGSNSMRNGAGAGTTGYTTATRNTQASILFAPALAPAPQPRPGATAVAARVAASAAVTAASAAAAAAATSSSSGTVASSAAAAAASASASSAASTIVDSTSTVEATTSDAASAVEVTGATRSGRVTTKRKR